MAELKDVIDGKQADVNKRLKVVEEARKVNLFENEKNRKYAMANAALSAKLAFIEQKYDYTSSVKQLSLDDFAELVKSNSHVNETIEGFSSKLNVVQKEVQNLEATRKMSASYNDTRDNKGGMRMEGLEAIQSLM